MASAMNLPAAELAILKSEDKRPATLAIVITFTLLAFVTICLRYFARWKVTRSPGPEDYLIGAAMAFSIAMGACQIVEVYYGMGRHMMFLELWQVVGVLKFLYWSIFTYCTALTLIKISILMQYRRIFENRPMRIAVYATMAFVIANGIEADTTGLFTCIPPRAFWDVTIQPVSKCIDQYKLWYSNAALNIFSDLVIAVLPLRGLWKLQLPTRQRVVLMMILGIGWFVCVVSILRLHAVVNLGNNRNDATWYGAEGLYWSCIEVNVAIICASLPALKPLVVHFFPRFDASAIYSDNSRSSGSKTGKVFPGLGKNIFHGRKTSEDIGSAQAWDLERGFSKLKNKSPQSPTADGERTRGDVSKEAADLEQTVWHLEGRMGAGRKNRSESERSLVALPLDEE
ncbi:hypothetical protein CC80DRAFT_445548 [Byssothecium circinans]|uniref:Rhodopsin domain-containing protein n=1 Tax=Byssothecium circinans TaxID=147558 RepID=A0A6A5TWW4_9PLEO|nr:hypothetical protein CC80DRAFT_445548 [Byssothecium circinans]